MNCPVCATTLQIVNDSPYCPNCKIFVGNQINSTQIQRHTEREDFGKTFQERARKSTKKKLIIVGFVVILLLITGYTVVMNFTSFGYREKIFDRYNFTSEARAYLRSKTQIEVVFLETKRPVGLTHAGLWKPGSKTVKLNSANDEVAIHEFAHAWWEEKRKDLSIRRSLINDTHLLSKMVNPDYSPVIKTAAEIISVYCRCPEAVPKNLSGVDDHHFYAVMAHYTMGNFKTGSHKLPTFMWEYFDDLFEGENKVVPCYEVKECTTIR